MCVFKLDGTNVSLSGFMTTIGHSGPFTMNIEDDILTTTFEGVVFKKVPMKVTINGTIGKTLIDTKLNV